MIDAILNVELKIENILNFAISLFPTVFGIEGRNEGRTKLDNKIIIQLLKPETYLVLNSIKNSRLGQKNQ